MRETQTHKNNNWIDEALTEDGIGDYLSLDAVIDRRNQERHLDRRA